MLNDLFTLNHQNIFIPATYQWMTRTLLRFSSVIENVGTDVFKPLEDPDNWEWHACHMHYHSMKVFSRYEVVDTDKRLVSVGLKASFCLEDNICRSGSTPKFRCSNVIDSKGTQGKIGHSFCLKTAKNVFRLR
ncbi:hypothetical protein PHET_00931 [Paragonimus heterotremus]|uniref:Uncharacterized protein n=1 Tax=Paragonimus heterotremus TaxID=100268 RepID=A0A8J4SU36_9TREM|nr:hypothetical protein PHET_00931 [Paragonimus heterotremus]